MKVYSTTDGKQLYKIEKHTDVVREYNEATGEESFERVGARNPYSTMVVEPKVAKFRERFVSRLKKPD